MTLRESSGPDSEVWELLRVIDPLFPRLGTEVTDADDARRILREMPRGAQEPIAIGPVTEHRVPARDGTDISVRRYEPMVSADGSATIVFVHGGGWVLGDLDSHDTLVREIVKRTGIQAISVDYRRAPEHRYPIAVLDVLDVLDHIARTGEWGVDPWRLVLMGDSAGANLVAGATLMDRSSSRPDPARMVLLYPVLDDTMSTASYTANGSGRYIGREHLAWFWQQYLGETEADEFAAPTRAADLSGWPPTLVVTAELDPLRDEGRDFAARLRDAGVVVTAQEYRAFHGFLQFSQKLEIAQAALDDIAHFITGELTGDVAAISGRTR